MTKKELQIVGAEIIAGDTKSQTGLNGIVKLTCIPFSNVRVKKSGFFNRVQNGATIEDLTREQIEETNRLMQKTILFITVDEYLHEYKNKLFTKITLDITPDVFINESEV